MTFENIVGNATFSTMVSILFKISISSPIATHPGAIFIKLFMKISNKSEKL